MACDAGTNFNRRIFSFHLQNLMRETRRAMLRVVVVTFAPRSIRSTTWKPTTFGIRVRSGSLSELEIKIRLVALSDLPAALRRNYEVYEWRHASAVLRTDSPNEWSDIIAVLSGFRLKKSQISVGGGAKSSVADSIDQGFFAHGWQEKKFAT